MKPFTQGVNFYPDWQLLVHCEDVPDLKRLPPVEERYYLLAAFDGAGIVRLSPGQTRYAFTAPVVFCLNDTEAISVEKSTVQFAQVLYFHPEFINSAFTLTNVRDPDPNQFPRTTWQDLVWLRPFLERSDSYHGQLHPGPASLPRLQDLLAVIRQELTAQKDWFWPCRSRSYFLELLFLLEQVFVNQDQTAQINLPSELRDIDQVLLYLHTNYQHKITVDDLTKAFHLNRTTLTRDFTAAAGQPPMAYLIGLRLRLAASMLRDTTIPVAEIMERTGFRDKTHFSRMFKKHLGYSPANYRLSFNTVVRPV